MYLHSRSRNNTYWWYNESKKAFKRLIPEVFGCAKDSLCKWPQSLMD